MSSPRCDLRLPHFWVPFPQGGFDGDGEGGSGEHADDAEEAKRYFEMGIDTILTDDYHLISAATGVR